MKIALSVLFLMISSIVLAGTIELPAPAPVDYATLQTGPWAQKNSWGLDHCGFQIYDCYQGESVSNLIEADTSNGLASSWAFMTVQTQPDVDKFVATKKPIAVYGLIPDIINGWMPGNIPKQQYLDYIAANAKNGYSIGVCEWENWFYWDTAQTKAIFGYTHAEMSTMTKNQIYNVIRTALLRWKADARNKMMMANGFGLIGHLSEIGVDLIGIETSENIPSTQFKRAITRGAARQFGVPWFEEVSAWYGPQITAGYPTLANWPYQNGVKYGGDAGHSMSHMKRIWYSSWFSGAGHIMQEASAQLFYESSWASPERVPKNPKISRFGQEAQAASKLWRKFDRGIPYTPFLILMGKTAGRWTSEEKPFCILEPNEADLMINKFIDQLYVDQSKGVGNEERYLCASPYGDTFDVMINDARNDAWSAYPVIFAMGEIFWTASDAAALRDYVSKGGVLVVNELNAYGLQSLFDDSGNLSASDLLTDQYAVLRDASTIILAEKALGKGRIIVSRNLNNVAGRQNYGYPTELLDSLYHAYVPIQVSGNVETLFNKTADGWAVMVINNQGIIKPSAYAAAPTIDLSKTQTVTLSFMGNSKQITDAFGNNFQQGKKDGKTLITFPIKPGEVRLMTIGDISPGWTDDFSAYPVGYDLYSPWLANGNMYSVSGGYAGNGATISVDGSEAYTKFGRAFRETGDLSTNYASVRFKLPGNGSLPGGISVGLQSTTDSNLYGLTGGYIKLEAYKSSNTVSKIYFQTNPGGAATSVAALNISSGVWWDMKIEKIGADYVAYAKLSTAANWSYIGTASGAQIPSQFVPAYLGITGAYNHTIVDDVTVSTVAASVSGNVVLEGYTSDQSAIAVVVDFIQNDTVISTKRVFLDRLGNFTIPSAVSPGIYDVAIKASASLKTVLRDVVLQADTNIGSIELKSGDLDGDNEITSTDISILGLALGLSGD